MTKDDKAAEDIFANVEEKSKKPRGKKTVDDVVEVDVPSSTDPGWNDYLMGLFTEEEVKEENDKKFPYVHGLRRVSELVFGKPLFSGPIQVFPSTDSDIPGRATVLYKVEWEDSTYTEVADCWLGNTDPMFLPFTVAMASTRAEARALRKALKLKNAAAEELTKVDTAEVSRQALQNAVSTKPTDGNTSDETLSDRQDNFINTLCDRAGIDRAKFISTVLKVTNPGKLTKRIASEAIDLLNGYANQTMNTPDSIKRD